MIIVGIDPGLHSLGFCFIDTQTNHRFTRAYSGQGDTVVFKALNLAHTMQLVIPSEAVVFMEDYAYGIQGGSLTQLAELGGILKAAIWAQTGFLPLPVATNTMRKFLSGKGNLKKEMIPREVMRRFQAEPSTSDECVALVLAEFGRQVLSCAGLFPVVDGGPMYAFTTAQEYATARPAIMQALANRAS